MERICPLCNKTYSTRDKGVRKTGIPENCKRCGVPLVAIEGFDVRREEPFSGDEKSHQCPRCGADRFSPEGCQTCGYLPEEEPEKESFEPLDVSSPVRKAPEVRRVLKIAGIGTAAIFSLVVAAAVFLFLFGIHNSEAYRTAKTFIKGNREVRKIVGSNPSFGFLPEGSYEEKRGRGRARFSIGVKGNSGSTTVHVRLAKIQGSWRVVSAYCKDPKGRNKVLLVSSSTRTARKVSHSSSNESISPYKEHLLRGHRLFREKRLEEALREYDQAARLDPERYQVFYWRGRLKIQMGKGEEAIRDFERTVRLNASYSPAYDNLGWLYAQRGEYERAIRYLNKSIELKPQNGWTYYQRGECLYRTGERAKALEDAKQACNLGYEQGCAVYEKLKQ